MHNRITEKTITHTELMRLKPMQRAQTTAEDEEISEA